MELYAPLLIQFVTAKHFKLILYFLYFIFESIAFLMSIILFSKKWDTHIKYFVPFLFFTVCIEGFNIYSVFYNHKTSFIALNFFTAFEFLFYWFLFAIQRDRNTYGKTLSVIGIIFFLIFLANIIFFQGLNRFHSYTFILGSLITVIIVLTYFKNLMRREEKIILSKNPFFWISSGLLIFYIGEILFMIFYEYLAYKNIISYGYFFITLSNILNFILYSSFIIAFAWARKNIVR
jgi:hypothetical protein